MESKNGGEMRRTKRLMCGGMGVNVRERWVSRGKESGEMDKERGIR